MPNEVVIEEYASFFCKYEDGTYAPVVGEFITSQVIDVGAKSAALDPRTKLISIIDKGGSGFWYKVGDTNVDAVADTAGNRFLPPNVLWNFGVTEAERFIDTAAVV
jgi:hypothetical protein